MIPRDHITEWRGYAPWVQDFQVEQDLVISRVLVAIFSHPLLSSKLAFRGGTAFYKLHIRSSARYSEDIDLVQVDAEPAGLIMDALHEGSTSRPTNRQMPTTALRGPPSAFRKALCASSLHWPFTN